MERIINIAEGAELAEKGDCIFCGEEGTKVFGIVDAKKKWNGYSCKFLRVCPRHVESLNALLDGQKDIDEIIRIHEISRAGGGFNLRASI